MPSKKKPRPLFEVPVEIGAGRESGWVYRSGASAPAAPAPVPRAKAGRSVGSESAHTLALAIATLAQTFVVVVSIAVIPMTMGIQAIRAFAKPADR